jgi:hypothetical protein
MELMPGLQITLPVTFSGSQPVFREDPLLAPGSLWLFDVRSSIEGSGVPANGAPLYNLAWREAKLALGTGTEATLAAPMAITPGTGMTFERSGKGGFHSIADVTNIPGSGTGASIEASSIIKDHILAFPGHSYYLSAWQKITRVPGSPTDSHRDFGIHKRSTNWGQASLMMAYNGATGRTSVFYILPGAGGRANLPDLLRVSGPNLAAPHDAHVIGATSAVASAPFWATNSATTIVPPANASELGLGVFFGRYNAGAGPGEGSRIMYRVYLEDLTISGRTAATVQAADVALQTVAFASGGAFYNDTYTAPTTVYA